MVQLLGFQITRANDDREKPAEAKQAFTVPSPDDGTTTISAGGYYGQYLDMEVTAKNDVDLIKRYREPPATTCKLLRNISSLAEKTEFDKQLLLS